MRGFSVTILSIVALVAVLLVFSGSSVAASQVLTPVCKDLLAGQHNNVGHVCISGDAVSPVVTYTLSEDAIAEGWVFTEAHLWTGGESDDVPTNKAGNPAVGQFPYNSGDITGATEFAFELGSGIGGYSSWCGETFKFAAHAKLQKAVGEEPYPTESAWGDGQRINEKGNWATYFAVPIECVEVPDPEPTCETAFAGGDDDTALASILGSNNWGWRITVSAPELGSETVIERDIWAAAGQNDTDKGTKVGTLQITYDGSSVEVTYNMMQGFTLNETHLNASTNSVPPNGRGQYKVDTDLSGTIYIVAHAVVCGVFE